MKRLASLILGIMMLMPAVSKAADIEVKWTGPSGHGDMIFWNPGTGVTNLVIATNGMVTLSNFSTAGTLGVTGVATFTAESVHNGGIDTDYVTTDAGAGVDTKTAGTLLIGAATANKVEISKSGVATEVKGTMTVAEKASFTVVPGFNATVATPGGVAGLMTNLPANSVADPIFIKMWYGTTSVVVPAYVQP